MLNAERITREELYEAVWSESIHQLSKALGISDVGLAKVCKKLNVPVPGRGYWAKGRASRKLLRTPLPELQAGAPTEHRITQAHVGEAGKWTRETLQHLAEEGVCVPSMHDAKRVDEIHALIRQYRGMLKDAGLGTDSLRASQACLAINVSSQLLDRALKIAQSLFDAFEGQGYPVEVRAPIKTNPAYPDSGIAKVSQTGVTILGTFVAFELREEVHSYRVATPPTRHGKGSLDEYVAPTYRREATGVLTLRILEPRVYGIRDRWQDMKRLKIEDRLEAFMLSTVAIAEYKRQVAVEREQQAQKEMEAIEKAARVAARRKELSQRLHDLDSRIQDCLKAEQIREFLTRVEARNSEGAVGEAASPEVAEWMAWAESLADELESDALGTILHFRKPPEPITSTLLDRDPGGEETYLRHQVDMWQRRYIFGRR